MEIGIVTGTLSLRCRASELEGKTVLLVQTQQRELAAEALVQAQVGDRVLVTKADRSRFAQSFTDAAVVAIVENANCC